MIKVTALTSGKYFPSSRFRVRQYIEPLRALGIDVAEHYPLLNKYHTKRVWPLGLLARLPGLLAARTGAITWFERELAPGKYTLESYSGTRRLLDVDDAIWLNGPNFSERLALLCDGVVAGNEFIAEYYRQLGARVWTIPTSLDTTQWRPARSGTTDHWTIGWTGTSSNLKFLYAIEEALADFLAAHHDARVLVVCDRRPQFKLLPPERWRFVPWTPAGEVRLVQAMDVGLMPLPNSEWTRGKCALKMLMYLACGIPAVVSPVGVSEEILRLGEVGLSARDANDWFVNLDRVYADRELAAQLGAAGRKLVEERFSVQANVPRLAQVIEEIAG